MPSSSPRRRRLWAVYARSVSLVSVLGLVAGFVIGGYDLVELAFPRFTLSAGLHEKYQSNEAFTKFGALKKDLSEEEITRERVINYAQMLRMERRSALQSLIRVGWGLLAIGFLNLATFSWNPR